MELFEGLKAVANIHPLFVHFPIALLLLAVFLFFAGKFVCKKEFIISAKWDLVFGAFSGLATIATGFIAANTLPHNEEIHRAMISHRNIMILAVFLSLNLCGYIFYRKDLLAVVKNIYFLVGLVLMAALLTIGADYGGKMVFKYGAGTELFLQKSLKIEQGSNYNDKDEKGGHNH